VQYKTILKLINLTVWHVLARFTTKPAKHISNPIEDCVFITL